jgi:hypothetical protein
VFIDISTIVKSAVYTGMNGFKNKVKFECERVPGRPELAFSGRFNDWRVAQAA